MRNFLEYIGMLVIGLVVFNIVMIHFTYIILVLPKVIELEYGFNLIYDLRQIMYVLNGYFILMFIVKVPFK